MLRFLRVQNVIKGDYLSEAKTEAVFRQTLLVSSYEVDCRGRVRPSVLFSYMLDSAWKHVKNTGFSYSTLLADGKLWAASKFLIVFNTFPKWNDEVIIDTWGKAVDRFYAMREFVIYSKKKEKLASATSSWLIIDRNRNRPQKMDRLWAEFPFQPGVAELDVEFEKLPALSTDKIQSRYVVRFSDIDINKHATASSYMKWILDSFPAEVLENKTLKSFEINFMAEAQLDDKISVTMEADGESCLCNIKRERDSKEMCRERVAWNDLCTDIYLYTRHDGDGA